MTRNRPEKSSLEKRAKEIFAGDLLICQRHTARLFTYLFVFQWLAVIVTAVLISPYSWHGTIWTVHIHLYSAVFLGGLLALFPIYLSVTRSEECMTHHVIAASQVLFSCLLIHLSGGRIETHFHIFGSLAFIAFFRNWKLLMTATSIVALDHLLRGAYWPDSVYGVSVAVPWRTLEHACWMIFEDIFLIYSIVRQREEMRLTAARQATLESTYALVELQVEDRTCELEHAKQDLIVSRDRALESVAAKGRFLANMSHEIRTPLNAIVGFSDLIMDTADKSSEIHEFAEEIVSSSRHLLSIVNDILDFSKIEAGKMTLHPEEVEMRPLLSGIVRNFDGQVKAKNLNLAVSIGKGIPERGMIDPHRLRQIMINLIGNAIKFTPENGGIIVAFEACTRDESSFMLSGKVADSGIGVPQEGQHKIFEAFEQVDDSHTRLYGGTGLGLAITSELLRTIGGTIDLQSKVGVGSCFEFSLPVRNASSSTCQSIQPVDEPIPAADHPQATILLVEDNAVNRKLVETILKKRGYRVAVACDGFQAVEMVTKEKFDLVLMDIQMPVMDGESATRAIRDHEVSKTGCLSERLPIIALTAHAMIGDREKYLAGGMDGYVSKPVSAKELENEIVRLLSNEVNAREGTQKVTERIERSPLN